MACDVGDECWLIHLNSIFVRTGTVRYSVAALPHPTHILFTKCFLLNIYTYFAIACVNLWSGIGSYVNTAQIQGMASKSNFALFTSTANDLDSLSDDVVKYTCEGNYRILSFFLVVLIKVGST